MRGVTIAVCVLVLTAGCLGNGGIHASSTETEEAVTEAKPTPKQPTTPSSQKYNVDVERIEDIIHEKMNERREENGLESLARNETLDVVARYKSWDMAQRDYFAHTGANGTRHAELRNQFDTHCKYSGQNIYKDNWAKNSQNVHLALTNNEKIASAAVRLLLTSPGHRENALSPHYDSQGIGVFVDENGTVFLTQELCG
ncbi:MULTISPECIES: CAP domain-containing protein [Halolamina]|uniref:Uncharacterized conserved protein YkwD, contains CAP (CSP/antigen 5/PR1) domain n=1 Tax=Halolamina pelagica TaxID=699431 RepID=A0A1I5P5V6_9EURY|nr:MULTISPECIES: CAP domain-containing protein [Halolamina]NHX36649.1 CAP domain-containing protein [Halolamina sp. R1-12]SFP29472.1 Uncharacterized conserved protein YkwD, contains CAP (CSP/antigen 5/PR1) domain [Halolamina pelagica]